MNERFSGVMIIGLLDKTCMLVIGCTDRRGRQAVV